MCLIIPIIWGFPKPQFGDYGDEVVNETENENPNGDPIGDIFKDIISGFGLLMQDGINLITNVTQNNVSKYFIQYSLSQKKIFFLEKETLCRGIEPRSPA